MWTLLIETSTDRGIVGIYHDEECRYFSCLPLGYENSRFVIPKIEEGLKELSLKPENLQLIVAGVGPGSYTGTRVGVVIAKTMAYAQNIPIVGICSLEGFIPDKDGPFAVIIDAKLSGAIIQKGSRSGESITHTDAPELITWEKVQENLAKIPMLVTPNGSRIQPKLTEKPWIWEETAPDPLQMIRLGKKKFFSGNLGAEIIYLTQP